MATHRPLYQIAEEIVGDWKKPYFGALPYIDAMNSLDQITGSYGAESAQTIVRYFLVNAGTWKGETARRIKAELKALIK
jgi:hypothetical protein